MKEGGRKEGKGGAERGQGILGEFAGFQNEAGLLGSLWAHRGAYAIHIAGDGGCSIHTKHSEG